MTFACDTEVAVIIVNYNTVDLALNAVQSVLTQDNRGRRVKVYLVDNASPNGDGDVLMRKIVARGWEDIVTLYREKYNHGFGRGNNLVLKALLARSDPPRYVLLLNPDAQLKNNAIAILAEFLDSHCDVAVVGARIENPDGHPVTSAFRFPGLTSTFTAALSFGPVSRLLSRWTVPLSPAISTRSVDWVAGAAVMLRLSAVREAGLFDPTYFLYFEEVDLMRQITRQGGKVWYVAEARAIHIEGASTNVKSGRPERQRLPSYWYESWQYYFRKNHGRAFAILAALVWILGVTVNYVISLLRNRTPAAPLRFYRDLWVIAFRPLLGI